MPTLKDVKVGDYVWNDYTMYGTTRTHLSEITHIDAKGRLFICLPEADYGNAFKNWRYGFDPATGKPAQRNSTNYQGHILRYASPEQIATVEAVERQKKEQEERTERERVALYHVKEAGPVMLPALEEALQFVDCNCGKTCAGTCTHSKMVAAIKSARRA